MAGSSSGLLLGTNLTVTGIGLLTSIIAARVLGPEQRGDLAVITYWPLLIVSVVDIAILDSIALKTASDQSTVRSHLLAGSVIAILASIVGMAGGFLALPALLQHQQLHLLAFARAYLLFVPIAVLSAVPFGALLGLQRFRQLAAIRFAAAATYLVLLGILVVLGRGTPFWFAVATLVNTGLQIPMGVLFLIRAFRAGHRQPLKVGSLALTGAKLHATRIVGLLGTIEDRALANLTLPLASIGVYQIPANLSFVMPAISTAFTHVLFSRMPATVEKEKADLIICNYVRATMLILLFVACVTPLFPFIIPLAYGDDFRSAVVPSFIVAVAGAAAAGAAVLQAAARASMHIRICVEAELGSMVVLAALAFLLTAQFDINGLATAYLGGRAFALFWMAVRAPPVLGFARRDLLPWSLRFRRALLDDLRMVLAPAGGPPPGAGTSSVSPGKATDDRDRRLQDG